MRLTLITALITLVVDQLTNLLVVHGLPLRGGGGSSSAHFLGGGGECGMKML